MITLDDDDDDFDSNDSDDMYEVIEINHELSLRYSKHLILAPSDKQIDSPLEHDLYLELVILCLPYFFWLLLNLVHHP